MSGADYKIVTGHKKVECAYFYQWFWRLQASWQGGLIILIAAVMSGHIHQPGREAVERNQVAATTNG